MSDVIRAELRKLAKRPAVWVLLAAAAVLNQIFAYLIPYLSYLSGDPSDVVGSAPSEAVLASTLPDQLVVNTIGAFPVFAGALALVLGALSLGGEYGFGTVKTLLTQRPGRTTVVTGQLAALAVAVAVAVAALLGLGAVSSAAIALVEGAPLDWPSPAALATGAGTGWLVLMMWVSLGGALAVVLRGVALPVGLGVVWVLGIENLLSAMAGSLLSALEPVRDVLPGVNAGSLVSAAIPAGRLVEAPPGVTATVGEPQALVTLVCYLVGCAAVAVWTTRWRDVA